MSSFIGIINSLGSSSFNISSMYDTLGALNFSLIQVKSKELFLSNFTSLITFFLLE